VKIIFIASPFRARTEWGRAENVRHAERAALQVWKLGAVAVCPQANSALFQDECPDEVFLKGYRHLLRRCDAVLIAGQESEGVRAELAEANARWMPVFHTVEALGAWLKVQEGVA
jgi:hypothetical protein